MADSLRDQLIAAGFEAPAKPAKKPVKRANNVKRTNNKKGHANKGRPGAEKTSQNKPGSNKPSPGKKNQGNHKQTGKAQQKNTEADAAIAARKKLKAQIKALIDNNKLENWKGEIAYRYTVDKRIRELYVNEPALKHLTARKVAITRLNGDTYLVPIDTANEIIEVNPQWSVFNVAEVSEETASEEDEYAEFQVPDDLQW